MKHFWVILGCGILCAPSAIGEDQSESYPGVFDGAPVIAWQRDLPGESMNSPTHAERARPVLTSKDVFVGSAGGQGMYRLSRITGSLTQTYPAAAAVNGAPHVDDDTLIFTDNSGTTWSYHLNGDVNWTHEGKGASPSPPEIYADTGYFRDVRDTIYALGIADGAAQWKYRHRAAIDRTSELTLFAGPQPTYANGVVFAGFSDGTAVALNAVDGREEWRARVGEGEYPDLVAPVVVQGDTAYVGGYLGPFVALDKATGNVRWRLEIGTSDRPVFAEIGSQPVLIHPGTDGIIRAIDPVAGDLQWTWSSGVGAAMVQPVVTDAGLVIAGTNGTLVVLDTATGEETWRWSEDYMLSGVSTAPFVKGRQMAFTTNAGRLVTMVNPDAASRYDRQEDWPRVMVRPKKPLRGDR